jgi:hypothetical protein
MPYGNDFSDHAYCESADSESTRVPAVGRLRRSVQELAESSRLEAALSRKVRVIPVLVDRAQMPSASELPPSLQRLAGKHAVALDPISRDLRSLVSVLKSIITPC